ncbi:hypothetical protein ACFFLS_25310 [Flavobacterium procerum]|uniref:MoxR-vWA-beta-propeller ternary system domain-containing protein n=1 Tax=Flavobacterium procerum TaxID=1455569 RepID=A0ABV6BY53_9FLAO
MYLLEINKEHKSLLGVIRHWENLKTAFDADSIWIKDFSFEQINSDAVLQIPYVHMYELKENLLFEKGKLLPSKKLPSGLLWTPIVRALPVSLPGFNHNFFGINHEIEISLIPSEEIKDAFALLVNYNDLKAYIETAPRFRLEPLQWVIIDDKILIIGNPQLPIKGSVYWFNNYFLIPVGYDFEWFSLIKKLQDKLNPSAEKMILWNKDGTYTAISSENIKPLSLSSFRLTFS